jgi:hypothetical protein
MAPRAPHIAARARPGEIRDAPRVSFCVALALTTAFLTPGARSRPGVEPSTPWSCPDTHPIKGYVSAESGARVYHVPGGAFYEEASPERCYATDEEAQRDRSRPAREARAPSFLTPTT